MELTNPELDWVALANGMGVAATRVATVRQFEEELEQALATGGPKLLELCMTN